jgi:hypothetical protein
MIETPPLTDADAAYKRVLSGKARFRTELTTKPPGSRPQRSPWASR